MSIEVKIRCPLCDTDGWASFARLDGYHGVCGTSWGAGLEPRQSEQCRIIAALRWEVTFLRLLAPEVAA